MIWRLHSLFWKKVMMANQLSAGSIFFSIMNHNDEAMVAYSANHRRLLASSAFFLIEYQLINNIKTTK